MVAAGFSAEDADRLRRAMATFRHTGTIHTFRKKMVDGMVERGYEPDFAERCFKQIDGFGNYGFPESHAASFALLAYASAWVKCHYPDVFCAALLNSQPMGFYAPAQIVRDAREHGVEVRAVDVSVSAWDCTLEPASGEARAVRLGLRQVKGLKEADAERITEVRADGPFFDIAEMAARTGLGRGTLECLARADAFASLGLGRRTALWAIRAIEDSPPLPLLASAGNGGPPLDNGEPEPPLPEIAPGEAVAEDYRSLRLTLREHPAALLRARLDGLGYAPCNDLTDTPDGAPIRVAGLALVRQRPGTASGVIFMTIEDEDAIANLVIWPRVFERFRRETLTARLVGVRGRVQKEGTPPHQVIHVVADRLEDLSALLDSLNAGDGAVPVTSRNFH
jgi:error-prone DNA polymerase